MRIYWTFKSIPELADLPARERRRVWRAAYYKVLNQWQTYTILLACSVCSALGVFAGHFLGHPTVGAGIGGGMTGLLFSQIIVPRVRPHIREVLARR